MNLKEKILWTTNLLRNKTLLGITWKLKVYYSYMKHVWGKYDLETSRKLNKENSSKSYSMNLFSNHTVKGTSPMLWSIYKVLVCFS